MTKSDNLQKKVSAQGISISNLNGDIMSKIRECDIYKKENKILTSQMTALNRKCVDVNKRKMEHVRQLKKIKMETESIKMCKHQQIERAEKCVGSRT
jgi:phosphoenolpyruvate synthase/pyruvate phosphate dikinase